MTGKLFAFTLTGRVEAETPDEALVTIDRVLRTLGFQDFGDGSMVLDTPKDSRGDLRAVLSGRTLYADQVDIGDLTLQADEIEGSLDA